MIMEIRMGNEPTLYFTDPFAESPYHLARGGWRTDVPRRSRSLLAGARYTEVVEQINLHIGAASFADCLAAYHALVVRFDDAAAFAEGNQPIPVIWTIQPDGALASYIALILGPDGDTPMVGAAPNIIEMDSAFWIRDIPVRFRRKPLLCLESLNISTLSTASAQGLVQTVSFITLADTESPTKITINGMTPTSGAPTPRMGLVIVTPHLNINPNLPSNPAHRGLQEHDFAALSGADPQFSIVNDATALGGSVLNFTPTSNTFVVADVISSIPAKKIMLFATVKNLNTSKRYLMQAIGRVFEQDIPGRIVDVSGDSVYPQIVSLGMLTATSPIRTIRIMIRAMDIGGSFQIDRLVIVSLDHTPVSIIPITENPNELQALSGGYQLTIDDQYTTSLDSSVSYDSVVNANRGLPYLAEGDISVFTKGNLASIVWLAVSDGSWTQGANRPTIQTQASRRIASLIPR